MAIQIIQDELQEYAEDIKLNLGSVLSEKEASGLSLGQIYGTALACAYTVKSEHLIEEILDEAAGNISPEQINAAKTAATVMAMNNVYYRTLHIMNGGDEYLSMPSKLRMNKVKEHGAERLDYELYALAVSVVNGCGMCINAHVKQLEKLEQSKQVIQTCFRIAAVIVAVDQALAIG